MGTDSGDGGSTLVEFGIDDRPPLSTSLLLGVQHYLTMVGANIAVPLILANLMGMPGDVTAKFVGTFFVVSGLATLAQTTIGNRYPIVQGAPFSMLAPGITIVLAAPAIAGMPDWNAKLLFLQGAIIVASLAEVAIGYFGIVGKLRQYISPVVVAPVVALIGLSLFQAPQFSSATANWYLVLLTLGLIVLFSQYLGDAHRVFDLFPVLLGIAAAWVIALVGSLAGVIAPGTAGYIDLSSLATDQLIFVPYPLMWGTPRFETAFIIGMFAGVLASIVESFADYHAVARMSGVGAPSKKRINHGIGMEGLANVFSGLMGTGGSTSYSENIGAIGLTGVASRFVIQIGAAAMILVGVIPLFGKIIATMPAPIVGGLYIAMFGQIVAVGLSNLKYVDLDSSRNLFIIGVAVFAGMAVPAYMGNVDAAAQGMDSVASGQELFTQGLAGVPVLGSVLGSSAVAGTLYIILKTHMAVGGVIALFLDNTVAGTPEARGLSAWADIAEGEADFRSFPERVRGRAPADD
ncbi:uracil-xanthine permease family protein [Natronomonas sp. EA1]|uniref:uracil-xanthine permease family protein n=1 Tax=Natronomonas sp. EA1 TaxID=3421655 RepID=UPI003EBE1942